MKPEMSEFSYGFAFTNELVSSLGSHLLAAPEFPSLQQEGRPGGGAYYRWHMHALRHSAQHDLLSDLESKGHDVFYIAPVFHQTAELNTHYLAGDIVDESAAFRPREIGALPDDEEHYVVFNKRHLAYRCSDAPVQVEFRMMKDRLAAYKNQLEPRALNELGIITIADEIVDVLRQSKKRRPSGVHKSLNPDDVARAIRSRPALETLAFLSRTVLDSELLIIAPPGRATKRIQRRRKSE